MKRSNSSPALGILSMAVVTSWCSMHELAEAVCMLAARIVADRLRSGSSDGSQFVACQF
jgi:hypothetical protein